MCLISSLILNYMYVTIRRCICFSPHSPITLSFSSGDYNIFHNNLIFIILLLLPVLTYHAHFRCWTKPENQTKTDNFWQRVDDAIKYPIAGAVNFRVIEAPLQIQVYSYILIPHTVEILCSKFL